MPEGAAVPNFAEEPRNETGDFLTKGPAAENVPESAPLPDYSAEAAELDAAEQANIAISLAGAKQRKLQQIQSEINKLQRELGGLEKDLTDFRDSALGGFLKIFQPRITVLIDIILSEMKKQASKLSDEARIAYYTGLIAAVSSLIAILTALKFLTAFVDAGFLHFASCLRLIISTFYTCIIPLVVLLISPIYVPFLAIIFLLGKIPLFKGFLTQNIADLVDKLKKQRAAWRTEIEKLQKKVALRKQIKGLRGAQEQVARES